MTLFQTVILSLLQGICEFLPISSSAHLALARKFFSIDMAPSSFFDLFCHGGTTLSAIFFLRHQIFSLLKERKKELLFLVLAILPLIPIYFFTKRLRIWMADKELIGLWLMLTAFILFIAAYSKEKSFSTPHRKIADVLSIGVMQGASLFSGLSRSGLTISTACMRGWAFPKAIEFSFLLAIPTVLGGIFLESLHYIKEGKTILQDLSVENYLVGFFISFFVGLFTIRFIFSLQDRRKIKFFGWYCLFVGMLSLLLRV